MIVAQPLLDVLADFAARAREMARHRGFVLAEPASDGREREVLGVVAGEAEPIAGRTMAGSKTEWAVVEDMGCLG